MVTEVAATKHYVREGKCNRCGFCCVGGSKNEPCAELVWDGEIAVCAIYGNHPPTCKSFPDAPPILTDKCGYYFIDLWTNKRLKAREV